jgi:aspartate carbamoyltransferase regulatory subunit
MWLQVQTMTTTEGNKKMIRYTLFVLAVASSAATAWASMTPATTVETNRNMTVIEKNQFWTVVDKITVAKCDLEDCSDTPQGS